MESRGFEEMGRSLPSGSYGGRGDVSVVGFNFDVLWVGASVGRLFCRSFFAQVADGGERGVFVS